MRPRPTWRTTNWSQARWVRRLPELLDKYPADVVDAVENLRAFIEDRRSRPTGQDMRRTLAEIAKDPRRARQEAGEDLGRMDGYTRAHLVTVVWQRLGTVDLRAAPLAELAECARLAAGRALRRTGRAQTDDLAVRVVALVQRALPAGMPAGQRDSELGRVLRLCGLAYSQKSIERLRGRAGGLF